MLTYQARQRIFRFEDGSKVTFPNAADITFVFAPLQPFGAEPGGGRTAVRAVAATFLVDANTGKHTIESTCPLEPLNVTINTPDIKAELNANELTVSTGVQTLDDLSELVAGLYFGLPLLLNVEFADPPVVTEVRGAVGGLPFRWEYVLGEMENLTTTQQEQEGKIALAWDRFELINEVEKRRVAAALHYFHLACRLNRVGNSPWEFMSESILNLAKILEVIFPPSGDENTREAARAGLKALGYTTEEIERDFISAMALRAHIDVAHVHLASFTSEQLRVLHSYADKAEWAFRKMLQRLIREIDAANYQVPHYLDDALSKDAIEVVNRLAEHFNN